LNRADEQRVGKGTLPEQVFDGAEEERLVTQRFEQDTAVTRLDHNHFAGRLDPAWWIVEGPNGGYLAAILLRALTLAVGDSARSPRSLTVHFTERPETGPVEIVTRVERRGRSLTTSSARMRQGDRLVALAVSAFSKPRASREFQHLQPPAVISAEKAAAPAFLKEGGPIPVHDRYEYRWAIAEELWTHAERARSGAWIRLREPSEVGYPLVAALTDALPPAVFSVAAGGEHFGGVPTIDLTIHFRAPLPWPGARPDGHLLAFFESQVVREGFIEEDGQIWSRDGVLLAQSRQLALLR
jgi:acyl-CoA thioesterase